MKEYDVTDKDICPICGEEDECLNVCTKCGQEYCDACESIENIDVCEECEEEE